MIPSAVPKELQGLTQTEEMLIARALPMMRVYVRPGGQRGYSGHCINLPQKVEQLASKLSRVKTLSSLVVEPMCFERLEKIKSAAIFQYRLQEQERLQRLADDTATSNE